MTKPDTVETCNVSGTRFGENGCAKGTAIRTVRDCGCRLASRYGWNFQSRALATAALSVSSLPPGTGDALVTFPFVSIKASTSTRPSNPRTRQSCGYGGSDGRNRTNGPAIS